MAFTKTIQKALERFNRRVVKETGTDISDFLLDVAENHEIDEDGKKATSDYIVRALENEAEFFIDHNRPSALNKDYPLDGLSTCVSRYCENYLSSSCGDWKIDPIDFGKRAWSNFELSFGGEPVAYCNDNSLLRGKSVSDKCFLAVCDIISSFNPDWNINEGEKLVIDRKNASVR